MIKTWADYLVQNSLNPGIQFVAVHHHLTSNSFTGIICRQTSQSDGISLVNQTNLSLKGVIGIGAMAKISAFLNISNDASMFDVRSYLFEVVSVSLYIFNDPILGNSEIIHPSMAKFVDLKRQYPIIIIIRKWDVDGIDV